MRCLFLLKMILLSGFIFGFALSEEGAKPTINFEDQATVLLKLKNKEFKTPEEIRALRKMTADLPAAYKYALNSSFKTDGWIGLGLNLVIPSLGNWAMGNVPGGIVTTTIYVGSTGCFLVSLLQYGIYAFYVSPFFAISLGLSVVEGILNLVLPFAFAADMNKKLDQALGFAGFEEATKVSQYQNGSLPGLGSPALPQLSMKLVSLKF